MQAYKCLNAVNVSHDILGKTVSECRNSSVMRSCQNKVNGQKLLAKKPEVVIDLVIPVYGNRNWIGSVWCRVPLLNCALNIKPAILSKIQLL